MTVWFSSDLHFCHLKVASIRGFASTKIHDQTVIAIVNRLVKPDDVFWLLGDMGVGKDEEILDRVSMLNGRKHLVTGNHDTPWPAHRNSKNTQIQWLSVFDSVQAYAKQSVCGTDFLLSHFPYEGDHDGAAYDRHKQYRLRDYGEPLLHGHTHTNRMITRPGDNIVGPVIHVGWDAWGKPVKDVDIKALYA